jgi:hypothetical protein
MCGEGGGGWDGGGSHPRFFVSQLGKLVKLATDTSELKLATGMMSPDEWIHRGLEFALKTWECGSEDRGRGGAGGDSKELVYELRWLDLAIDCFSKAGSTGQCLVFSYLAEDYFLNL